MGSQGTEVVLDFGLRAAWARSHPVAIGQTQLNNIGGGQIDCLLASIRQIGGKAGLEVHNRFYRNSGQCCRRLAAEALHDAGDGFCAFAAFLGDTQQGLVVHTVLNVELQEVFVEAGALGLVPGSGLSQHGRRGNRVLVAHKVAHKVAVGFFAADREGLLAFVASDQIRNPLEARQGVVGGDAVAARNALQQGRCDHGARDKRLGGHAASRLVLLQDVVDQDRSGLVAVQQYDVLVVVAYGNAHAVRVGIAANDHVGVEFLGLFNGQS